MAVFVFKLQSLLDLRAREEQSAQRDLALLMREKAEIDERLRRHQMAIDDGKRALREDLVGMVDVRRLRVQTHAAFGVMRDAQAAAIALAMPNIEFGARKAVLGNLSCGRARSRASARTSPSQYSCSSSRLPSAHHWMATNPLAVLVGMAFSLSSASSLYHISVASRSLEKQSCALAMCRWYRRLSPR